MKKVGRIVVVGALAGLVSLTGAGAAHADVYSCDSGEFCLWENNDYNSGIHNTYGIYEWKQKDDSYSNNHWGDDQVPSHDANDVLDNEASSARNRTDCLVNLFQDKYYGGAYSQFDPGAKSGALSARTIGDNRASSHKMLC